MGNRFAPGCCCGCPVYFESPNLDEVFVEGAANTSQNLPSGSVLTMRPGILPTIGVGEAWNIDLSNSTGWFDLDFVDELGQAAATLRQESRQVNGQFGTFDEYRWTLTHVSTAVSRSTAWPSDVDPPDWQTNPQLDDAVIPLGGTGNLPIGQIIVTADSVQILQNYNSNSLIGPTDRVSLPLRIMADMSSVDRVHLTSQGSSSGAPATVTDIAANGIRLPKRSRCSLAGHGPQIYPYHGPLLNFQFTGFGDLPAALIEYARHEQRWTSFMERFADGGEHRNGSPTPRQPILGFGQAVVSNDGTESWLESWHGPFRYLRGFAWFDKNTTNKLSLNLDLSLVGCKITNTQLMDDTDVSPRDYSQVESRAGFHVTYRREYDLFDWLSPPQLLLEPQHIQSITDYGDHSAAYDVQFVCNDPGTGCFDHDVTIQSSDDRQTTPHLGTITVTPQH